MDGLVLLDLYLHHAVVGEEGALGVEIEAALDEHPLPGELAILAGGEQEQGGRDGGPQGHPLSSGFGLMSLMR